MDELRTALRNMIEWAEGLQALYRFELEENTKPETDILNLPKWELI